MKIAIIGTGGVGGYFGARLAKAGFNVSFLARGEHLAAIRKKGLFVKSILGDIHLDHLQAVDRIKEIGKADLIILAVKAWQIKDIHKDLNSILHPKSIVLPLQNGVSTVDELIEVIDRPHVLGGLCRIMSKVESPGVISHKGITPTIVFGELDKNLSERARVLKDIFDRAEITTRISEDIHSDLWKKFISICVSGLLAVTRTTYGELRELKETRQMMFILLNEIYALSQAIGINIEADFIDKTVSFIDSFPYDSSSSLTRDVLDGKPSEIYYQNGTVVRLGEKYGVDTPVNRFVFNCILPMEIKARKLLKQ